MKQNKVKHENTNSNRRHVARKMSRKNKNKTRILMKEESIQGQETGMGVLLSQFEHCFYTAIVFFIISFVCSSHMGYFISII